MISWWWLVITAWLAGTIGLLIGAMCAVAGRVDEQRDAGRNRNYSSEQRSG